MMTDVESRNMQ